MKNKLPDFKFDEIYSIFLSASRPLLKKRALCRELVALAIQYIPNYSKQQGILTKDQFEKNLYLFYRVSQNFALKPDQAKYYYFM